MVTGLDVFCSLAPLRRLMAESDLVHLHFPSAAGSAAAGAHAGERPLVVTVHGNADVYELPPALEPVTRAVLTRADVVVSVSQDLGDNLRNPMGVPRVTVIPNGVDVEEFLPDDASREPSPCSPSRDCPRKNVHILIAAVEQLAREGADLSLVIAGTGPEGGDDRAPRQARHGQGAFRRLRRRSPQAHPADRTRTCSCSCRRAKACRSPRWRRSRRAFRASSPTFPACVSRLRLGRPGCVDNPEDVPSVVALCGRAGRPVRLPR